MEAVLCLLGRDDGDVVRQARVQGHGRAVGRAPEGREARHLGKRVHAGVRPARDGEDPSSPGIDPVERLRSSPSTVRCPGWAAQPAKSVPSYSSVSLTTLMVSLCLR